MHGGHAPTQQMHDAAKADVTYQHGYVHPGASSGHDTSQWSCLLVDHLYAQGPASIQAMSAYMQQIKPYQHQQPVPGEL